MTLSSKSPQTTKISITNLSLPHPISAPDVWGKQKDQPALLNVSLTLRGAGFSSAASLDKLDDSTIHYGNLAKKLRAGCSAGQNVLSLISAAEEAVMEMGRKGNGKFIVQEARVEVGLCKASMFGEQVKVVSVKRFGRDGVVEGEKWGFEVQEVKVMVLVGVNGYERQARQPLVVGFGVWFDGKGSLESLFGLESLIVEIIQDTSFETLETLVEHLVSELRTKTLDKSFPGSQLHLRIAKPRAIAFADAPVVEIIRDIPAAVQKKPTTAPALCIMKPYSR
ncbi:uncharacterized protein RCC_06644 [Ramularia collo-cygni]|uniref:Dihydroneopterin aldolase/epimerase domain-containing protein n=1 Tax=Ramularia collo-cygni TaxID=112498 RepID=A0A2D3VAT5_9PEZI|nr:uncharacterized protein RCC_06644 [Ramularia collo-cygni]CZT20786.1 uncharacterized protein RCC_06644 [Ramularia collo-cygni]